MKIEPTDGLTKLVKNELMGGPAVTYMVDEVACFQSEECGFALVPFSRLVSLRLLLDCFASCLVSPFTVLFSLVMIVYIVTVILTAALCCL